VHSRKLDACLPALTAAPGRGISGPVTAPARPLPAIALQWELFRRDRHRYGYEEVSARRIQALAVPDDVAVTIRPYKEGRTVAGILTLQNAPKAAAEASARAALPRGLAGVCRIGA